MARTTINKSAGQILTATNVNALIYFDSVNGYCHLGGLGDKILLNSADTDTYLTSSVSNTISAVNGGTEAIRILGNGNLQIGDVSGDYGSLSLKKSGATIFFHDTSNGGGGVTFNNSVNRSLYIKDNTYGLLFLSSYGYLRIGIGQIEGSTLYAAGMTAGSGYNDSSLEAFSGATRADTQPTIAAADSNGTGATADVGGSIGFFGRFNNATPFFAQFAKIYAGKTNNTNGDANGYLVFQTNLSGSLTERMRISNVGNVKIGTAAIATSATVGFLEIPSCAGTPSGVPASQTTGLVSMVYDSTNNKLYVYNGAWKGVTLA